jgi:6-pyruvoyltetrahydropterin/6-carboxytetrahydropterin synthase
MFELIVKGHFDAAHHLKSYQGKCNREHGHTWNVEVCVRTNRLSSGNIAIDFHVLEDIVDKAISPLDHNQLNEALKMDDPTAEILAQFLFERIHFDIGGPVVDVHSVTVWESPKHGVKYMRGL